MGKPEEKKIKLLLKDFINNHNGYEINPIYSDIYNDCDEIFQKIFAYFHERINILFEFMNTKSSVNNHFNAAESRDLLMIINELREIKKGLQKTNYDFEINESYIERIKYVNGFLVNSGGSPIPEDYVVFDVIKYEPIFSLKNKSIHLADFDQAVSVQASFKSDSITVKINNDILEHVKTLLETGHYFNSVEESYKIVRNKLKTITGKEKAHEAFRDDNYALIFGHKAKDEAEKDFFEGVKFLHMAIQKLRNEKAHTPARKIDKNLAIHYIVLASLAYDLISRNAYED